VTDAERPTFDVRELAASTAHLIPSNNRGWWVSGTELERWLIADGIAVPNGVAGRLVLTKRGVNLTATLVDLC
jgi:hypothetical protein